MQCERNQVVCPDSMRIQQKQFQTGPIFVQCEQALSAYR